MSLIPTLRSPDDLSNRITSGSSRTIMIVGGGLGGLSLAHALKRNSNAALLRVTVFERDESSVSRAQGFHLGLNRDGHAALVAACPASIGLERLSTETQVGFLLCSAQAEPLLRIGQPGPVVSRHALREALTRGLEENIVWNKRFVRYEEFADRVIVHFEDGSSAHGDLVVGADGANSAMRKQRCPDLPVDPVNVTSLGGYVETPSASQIPTLARLLRDNMVRLLGDGASVLLFAYTDHDGEDRLWWTLTFRTPAAPEARAPTDRRALNAYALGLSRQFHPEFHEIVRLTSDIGEARELLTVRPTDENPLGRTSRVTLIGDAAHAMTSHRGLGANTTFRDAVNLAHALSEGNWRQQVGQYEAEMIKRGFKAIRDSRKSTNTITLSGSAATVRNKVLWSIGCFQRLKCASKSTVRPRAGNASA